jgi:hypothetical protein
MSIAKFRRAALALTVLFLALTLTTCISGEERDYVTYDAATDEFQMLMVLQDLRVKDADDMGYLAALYANRDHLIAPSIPGGANIFSLFSFSFIRLSDKQVAALNIWSSRPSEIEAIDTTIPLNTIRIRPGAFFRHNGSLGYYHAITVPGKTLDAALEDVSKAMQNEGMTSAIQAEIERREGGGKTATWAQVNAEALRQIEIKPDAPETAPANDPAAAPATAPDDAIEPQFALDLDSLKTLRQAVSDKTLRIKRDKSNLSLLLPVTRRDADGLADLYKVSLARLQEVVKTTPQTMEVAEKLADARVALQVATALAVTTGDQGVTVTVDLLAMAKAMNAMPDKRIDLNDKDDAGKPAPDPVKLLEALNVPIFENITADQILKDFNAGTLKSYPSDKPVKPGEGIVAPKPADTLP